MSRRKRRPLANAGLRPRPTRPDAECLFLRLRGRGNSKLSARALPALPLPRLPTLGPTPSHAASPPFSPSRALTRSHRSSHSQRGLGEPAPSSSLRHSRRPTSPPGQEAPRARELLHTPSVGRRELAKDTNSRGPCRPLIRPAWQVVSLPRRNVWA